MCDKYNEIVKCNKCRIIIMPDCENHKYYLLEKYNKQQLQRIENIKKNIKNLEIELYKIL